MMRCGQETTTVPMRKNEGTCCHDQKLPSLDLRRTMPGKVSKEERTFKGFDWATPDWKRGSDAGCPATIEAGRDGVAHSATMPTLTPVTMSAERYLMGLPIYPPIRVVRSPLYSFLNDLDVPFTKNEAKRVLGKTEVEQKISGCFRTEEGAENFCILRTVIENSAKARLGHPTDLEDCARPTFPDASGRLNGLSWQHWISRAIANYFKVLFSFEQAKAEPSRPPIRPSE